MKNLNKYIAAANDMFNSLCIVGIIYMFGSVIACVYSIFQFEWGMLSLDLSFRSLWSVISYYDWGNAFGHLLNALYIMIAGIAITMILGLLEDFAEKDKLQNNQREEQ